MDARSTSHRLTVCAPRPGFLHSSRAWRHIICGGVLARRLIFHILGEQRLRCNGAHFVLVLVPLRTLVAAFAMVREQGRLLEAAGARGRRQGRQGGEGRRGLNDHDHLYIRARSDAAHTPHDILRKRPAHIHHVLHISPPSESVDARVCAA